MTDIDTAFRPFRITERWPESADVVSLWLAPERADDWQTFLPGQHLALALDCPGRAVATYTISSGPEMVGLYRLTVRRESGGRGGSQLLHELEQGARVMVSPPRGRFYLTADDDSPVLLLTAGVGITPAAAMLHAIARQPGRRAVAIHSSRDGGRGALVAELRQLATGPDLSFQVAHTGDRAIDPAPGDYVGRLTRAVLRDRLAQDRWMALLCGPDAFMSGMRAALTSIGIPDARIQQEVFSPPAPPATRPDQPAGPDTVQFSSLPDPVIWSGATLLDLAEAAGLSPDFSCRAGVCGECRCRLLSGEVDYLSDPVEDPPEGHVLLCCARPRGDICLEL